MTGSAAIRVPSWPGVLWSASAVGAGATTGGWQDKTAHIARRSVGCFCWAFHWFPHIAAIGRTLRATFKSLDLRHLSHIVGPRHGR